MLTIRAVVIHILSGCATGHREKGAYGGSEDSHQVLVHGYSCCLDRSLSTFFAENFNDSDNPNGVGHFQQHPENT